MSKTNIEWCHRPGTIPESWNPVTGCNKVSQGCKNCYAEIMHKRLQGMYPKKYNQPFLSGAVMYHDALTIPLRWKRPRTVFVNSMSDLFHETVSFEFINEVWWVMKKTPQHTYIILTKRPAIMHQWMTNNQTNCHEYFPLPNVWLGTSVEDQAAADHRIPYLVQTPAVVRFLSCEPLLSHVDITSFLATLQGLGAWVIVGGESGHKARPMHPEWARQIRDQCQAYQIPFFFKQWGEYTELNNMLPMQLNTFSECIKARKCIGVDINGNIVDHVNGSGKAVIMVKTGKHKSGRQLDGREWNEFPTPEPVQSIT